MSGFMILSPMLGVESTKKISKLNKKRERERCQFYEKEAQATQILSVTSRKQNLKNHLVIKIICVDGFSSPSKNSHTTKFTLCTDCNGQGAVYARC